MPRKSSASKRELNGEPVVAEERPQKKAKLLDNTDDEDSEVETGAGFRVNEEYARRFEHNKKRAEQHRRQSQPLLPHITLLTLCSRREVRQRQGFPERR
jgi:protein KRI1